MDVVTFISKFHNIRGTSLQEKTKNFFLLIKEAPQDHDALLAQLEPKTYLEHCFKLQLILTLHRTPELIQTLKNEEEYLPAKLIKSKWFCQKLATTVREDSFNFVNNILPFTSFVIRNRLLMKLAIYGTQMDSLYDEICARYGFNTAVTLLCACSIAKIKGVLKNQKINLQPKCQKLLYKKHPEIFRERLLNINEEILKYIARENIEDFLQITQNFNCSTTLGKHLTRKLLINYKETIFSNAKKYGCILRIKTVIQILSIDDLKRFFFNCFPSSIEKLRYGSASFCAISQKLDKRHYQFLREGITEVYNKSIYDYPDLVNEEIMESMDVEEREKWITIKREKGTPEEDLVKFMKISDAIPLIKSKINVTSSVRGRQNLIELLSATCRINNDLNALNEVCKYICSRHRNDDEDVLINFLYSLENFGVQRLEQRHWNYIDEILNIFNRKNDQSYVRYDFYIHKIECLFREKKLSDEIVIDFLKFVSKSRRWNYDVKDKNLKKILILKTIELAPILIEKEEKLQYKDIELLNQIFLWNVDNPKDKISIFEYPRLIESFRKACEDAIKLDDYVNELMPISTTFKHVICTKEKSKFRDETITTFYQVGFRYYNVYIDFWLLKNQPEILELNFDKFLKHVVYGYQTDLIFLYYMKKYFHSFYQEKIVDHCIKKINEDGGTEKIFQVLAIFAPSDKFLAIIEPFNPTEDKMEVDEKSNRKEWDTAIAIAKSFKYATSPAEFPKLLQYCKGDFLRYALESLYYRFYHSPENCLSTFINELSSKAVSVRKHSIFLTCTVGSISDVRRLIQHFMECERNVSVQKHLFTAVLKYFIKNPSDDFWESVKLCIKKLNRNDSESFAMLVNLYYISENYQARHVVFVWKILKESGDIYNNSSKLLSYIPATLFKNFPLEFLIEVISENFLKNVSSCKSVINNFVVHSLTQSNYKCEIMDLIFTKIREMKNDKYGSLEDEKTSRKMLSCFVSDIVSIPRHLDQDGNMVKIFSERWHSIFTETEAMSEHLKLSFVLLWLNANNDLEKFTNAIVQLLENLQLIYGVAIIDYFALELRNSLQNFFRCYGESEQECLLFCLNLIKNWNSLPVYLLVIKLLPNNEPSEDEARSIFLQIICTLRQVTQETVQMLMNLYVLDLN